MPVSNQSLKVALVYDKVNTYGGAERVLETLHQIFPEAPLFTSVYAPPKAPWAKIFPQVIPSFLNNFPFAKSKPQLYSPFMPLAFESFNFNHYDLVISISSYEAIGIVTQPQTKHIHYCLTPNRYLWVNPGYSNFRSFGLLTPFVHLLKAPILSYLRLWDQQAATRPDHIIVISELVKNRVAKYYRRKSQVIYPPVDTNSLKPNHQVKPEFFLLVSRMMPYKQNELVLQAAQELQVPLHVVGTGPLLARYQRQYTSPQIIFHGHIPQTDLVDLYQHAYALVMPQIEDFGLVALESWACGRPVILNHASGVAELVDDHDRDLTLINPVTLDQVKQKMHQVLQNSYNSQTLYNRALKYNIKEFEKELRNFLGSVLNMP